jgi:hypothetical protein
VDMFPNFKIEDSEWHQNIFNSRNKQWILKTDQRNKIYKANWPNSLFIINWWSNVQLQQIQRAEN